MKAGTEGLIYARRLLLYGVGVGRAVVTVGRALTSPL